MNLESYFISQMKNRHIGDDGAVIDGFVYSKDAFFEDVHFKKEWLSYYDIARKAMLVNISDAIAMNATPLYVLLSVAMPKSMTKKDMSELARGFLETASEFKIEVIGGDTLSNTKLDITVTVVSKTKKALYRSGMRSDYLVAYSGRLGNSLKELKKLFNKGTIHKNSKFIDIKLRQKFVQNLSRYISSGMDISDGLFSDLEKLALVNKKSFKFFRKIDKKLGCSGEEYEMLIAFDKRQRKAVIRRSQQSRVKLNIFAVSKRGRYTNRCKSHHF